MMYARVHRVNTEVFASINPVITFVFVAPCTRDTDAKEVYITVVCKQTTYPCILSVLIINNYYLFEV